MVDGGPTRHRGNTYPTRSNRSSIYEDPSTSSIIVNPAFDREVNPAFDREVNPAFYREVNPAFDHEEATEIQG